MAKNKKVPAEDLITEPVEQPIVQEGDKDPYAEGKHIKNPEPNNGADTRPEDLPDEFPVQGQVAPAADVQNSDAAEQDEVAEGREEPGTIEGQPEHDPADEPAGPAPSESQSSPAEVSESEDSEKPVEDL